MNLHLVDNGTTSLNRGLRSLKRIISKPIPDDIEYYGELKFVVLGLHNAIELYSKKLLSNINDLLIYDTAMLNDSDILNHLGNQYKSNKKSKLDYYLVMSDKDFATIGFQKCVERMSKCYDINSNDTKMLLNLNRYRNVLTHFGIEDYFSSHNILTLTMLSLDFLSSFMLVELNKTEEVVENKYFDYIEDLKIELDYFLVHNWQELYGEELGISTMKIDMLLDSDYICERLGDVIVDDSGPDIVEFYSFYEGDGIETIYLGYLPMVDGMFACTDNIPLFIIDLKSVKFYDDGLEVIVFNKSHDNDYYNSLIFREWDNKKNKDYSRYKLTPVSFYNRFKDIISI